MLAATTAAALALGCAGHLANEGPTRAWAFGMFDCVGFSAMAGIVVGIFAGNTAKGAALGLMLGLAVYRIAIAFW